MMLQLCQERGTHLFQASQFLFDKMQLAVYQFVCAVQLGNFCGCFCLLAVCNFDLPPFIFRL